ncbi:MAG: YhbY family RNA-binding protein, partial [Oscillospiraceae bacterium]
DGFSPNVMQKLEDELFAHELVKCSVLQNCDITAREAITQAAEKTGCEIVQVIGKKFVVYKPNPEKPIIIV